jgi:hypothetical protein
MTFSIDRHQNTNICLNQRGLGIGVDNPTENLHTEGRCVISKSSSVGEQTSSSNLHIAGSKAFQYISTSSDTSLGSHSIILANPSAGNITLQLPNASSHQGQHFTIKKISNSDNVHLRASDHINGNEIFTLDPSIGTASVSVISTGSTWFTFGSTLL